MARFKQIFSSTIIALGASTAFISDASGQQTRHGQAQGTSTDLAIFCIRADELQKKLSIVMYLLFQTMEKGAMKTALFIRRSLVTLWHQRIWVRGHHLAMSVKCPILRMRKQKGSNRPTV